MIIVKLFMIVWDKLRDTILDKGLKIFLTTESKVSKTVINHDIQIKGGMKRNNKYKLLTWSKRKSGSCGDLLSERRL